MPHAAAAGDLTIRPAGPADRPAILELAGLALGWGDDDRTAGFFAWKHDENPFGPSPAWVAMVGDRFAGFRTFLRWEFETPTGEVVHAVRCVDTATHPDFQGRGLFSRLTLDALPVLAGQGVGFVFNTPNEQSRPGYLKMGWHVVGRPSVRVRPRSAGALVKMARARVAAEKWSTPTSAGVDAADVFADESAVERLLALTPRPRGLTTHRSPAYLRWRYGFAPLHYRAALLGTSVEDGLAVFRLRRRGLATEATVCEVLLPAAHKRFEGRLLRSVLAGGEGDYTIRGERKVGLTDVPLPRQGPILTARALTSAPPPLAHWDLGLGDLELF